MTPVVRKRASRRASANRVAALFDKHASMVLGLCRILLRDHHEAEDAAQQVFVSAYRSLLRGVEPRDPGPWLAAIARNECRARIRKRIRTPLALDGELEEQLSDPSDLADLADRRVEFAAVTAAIAELPSRQREAVALRDFLGLSYEEVASTLSVSVPVVESLLFRARRRLRDTVRTAPRYAAGLVAVPLAFRAAVAREIPDFDGGGARHRYRRRDRCGCRGRRRQGCLSSLRDEGGYRRHRRRGGDGRTAARQDDRRRAAAGNG